MSSSSPCPSPSSPSSSSPPVYDTIIIGGGFSGLSAAYYFSSHSSPSSSPSSASPSSSTSSSASCSPPVSFLVLEARPRLGGRSCTLFSPVDNHPIDVGGAYIGPFQSRVLRLMKELNISSSPVHHNGKAIFVLEGKRMEYSGFIPWKMNPFVLLDVNYLFCQSDRLAQRLFEKKGKGKENESEEEKKKKQKEKEEWDGITVSEWLARTSETRLGSLLFTITFRTIFCCEPKETSMYFYLYALYTAGGVMQSIEVEGGAQERKVEGGTQRIVEKMADKVGRDKIKLGRVVKEVIVQNNNNGNNSNNNNSNNNPVHSSPIVVRCSNGEEYHCRSVIVAVAPSLYSSITFSPPLSPSKQLLASHSKGGRVIKTVLRYSYPFWREKGFIGTFASDKGPITYTFDDCHILPSSSSSSSSCTTGTTSTAPSPSTSDENRSDSNVASNTNFYGLMGFILADEAEKWSKCTAQERKQAIAEQYASAFASSAALSPLEYYEMNWNGEEYSKGGYCDVVQRGVYSRIGEGELRGNEGGRIYFASTELSSEWNGYIDGAIQTGERAAHAVMQQMKGNKGEMKEWNEEEPIDWRNEVNREGNGERKELLRPSFIQRQLPRPSTVFYSLLVGGIAVLWRGRNGITRFFSKL